LWSNDTNFDFCHQWVIYTFSSVYFNCTLISYVHGLSSVLISIRKLHALPFIFCYELNSVHVTPLIWKGDGQIYFGIIIISIVFVFILQHLWSFFSSNLSFCHIFGTSKILSLTYGVISPSTIWKSRSRPRATMIAPLFSRSRRQKSVRPTHLFSVYGLRSMLPRIAVVVNVLATSYTLCMRSTCDCPPDLNTTKARCIRSIYHVASISRRSIFASARSRPINTRFWPTSLRTSCNEQSINTIYIRSQRSSLGLYAQF
jgi:hypothetical protein